MKNVLFVDCCIRREASNTRKLAKAFLSALPSDCAVTRLDLMAEDLSYFKDSYFDQREALLAENRRDHPRFRYAHQFAQADRIVIAAPFWDLSFPALLKVYIEQVSVDGITFGSTEEGLKGLCRASHMIFLTTRGGFYTGDAMEMGSRYLDALHTFFGIGKYTCIAADGMNVAGFDAEASLCRAMQEAGLSERHARALLRLGDAAQRQAALRTVLQQRMSVAETEGYVETLLRPPERRELGALLSEVRRLLDAGACTDAEESAGPGGLSVTLFFPANNTFP